MDRRWALQRFRYRWTGSGLPGTLLLLGLLVTVMASRVAAESMESTADGWTTSCIDCPHGVSGFSHRAAALDSAGLAHIAYGGEQLYYASEQPEGGWEVEVVDENRGSGGQATLALDGANRPHIVYLDANSLLVYATSRDDVWKVEVVASNASQPIIAVDTTGYPHLSFYDMANADLIYAVRAAEGWQRTTVDSEGDVGQDSSLALDSQGRPHISYRDAGLGRLKYAVFDGRSWQVRTFDDPKATGYQSTLALDRQDEPHIAYRDPPQNRLMYSHREDGGWQIEVIEEDSSYWIILGGFGLYPSLRVDSGDVPHVSYANWGVPWPGALDTAAMRYARRTAAGWETQVVDVAAGSQAAPSVLLLNASGRPQILHLGASALLRASVSETGGWTEERVDNVGGVEGVVRLLTDTAGSQHVLYERAHYLVYAANRGMAWQRERVRFDRPPVDLGVGQAGRACILARLVGRHDATMDLECREGWDEEWSTVIGSLGDKGSGAVTLDAAGRIHLAYGDERAEPAAYQRQISDGWAGEELAWEVMELPVPRAQVEVMVLDPMARPHLVLASRTDTLYSYDYDIVYATLTSSGWLTETVESDVEGWAEYWPPEAAVLAVDSAGRPHLAYREGLPGPIYYAHRSDHGWHKELVAAEGTAVSIAVDQWVHLAYRATAGELIYARKEQDVWQRTMVAEGYGPGPLTLDAGGHAEIAFLTASPWSDPWVDLVLTSQHPVLARRFYLPVVGR